jgi:von Willebrand factor type A domain/Aerotolerance regulator N-terminal
MSFASILGLLVAGLVALPILAHYLQRRSTKEQFFAPTHLVKALLPTSKAKAKLDDRVLLFSRAWMVLLLALLAASPLVRCSRLSLERGASSLSLVIVVDDSMSMKARKPGAASNFEAAKKRALELQGALHTGDTLGIVLAGDPPRLLLPPTEDLSLAEATLKALPPSDRATSLSSALALAKDVSLRQPQTDKRVAVLSDLAGDDPEGEALSLHDERIKLWFPPLFSESQDLAAAYSNCAVLSAKRTMGKAVIRVKCTEEALLLKQELQIVSEQKPSDVLAKAAVTAADTAIDLPKGAPEDLVARLAGGDAIADDDRMAVIPESSGASIGILSKRDEALMTGGPPVLEQAFAALESSVGLTPLTSFPEQPDDLLPFSGLAIEDPAGFNPEQRAALTEFLGRGGVALMALGPKAASAPLGATFEPVLMGPNRYVATQVHGLSPEFPIEFGSATKGTDDLGLRFRTELSPVDLANYEVRARFADGTPFFLRGARKQGEVWLLTLPFSLDESDLALRPFVLDALDSFVKEAKVRTASPVTEASAAWRIRARSLDEASVAGWADVKTSGDQLLLTFAKVGTVSLVADGKQVKHFVSPAEREISFRKRKVAPRDHQAGGTESSMFDMAWIIALLVLATMVAEAALRLLSARSEDRTLARA